MKAGAQDSLEFEGRDEIAIDTASH
jgi:hypothetical protein